MPPDDSQNSNKMNNNLYTAGGYEKAKLRKVLLIVISVLVVIVITLTIHLTQPESQQSKYIKSATAAAKKQTPNAKVKNLKVAGGFAVSIVSDPSAGGQANSGNTTIFKVNQDGSMKQIANGSSFSSLDLLGLGIPLETQAKLTGSSVAQTRQTLASQCGYDGGIVPGYAGFGGSFNPGEWQIDSATLGGLQQALSDVISHQKPGNATICVNATQKDSNVTTDPTTYISTFTLQVQFITADGKLITHTLTFTIGAYHHLSYTLDGQDIQ